MIATNRSQTFHQDPRCFASHIVLASFVQKWASLFGEHSDDTPPLDPRVATATLVALENLQHTLTCVEGAAVLALGEASWLAAVTRRAMPQVFAHRIFQVQPLMMPVGVVAHGGAEHPVTVGTRKLRARYSPLAMQDLRAFHGIDAEVEMACAVAQELVFELDRAHQAAVLEHASVLQGSAAHPPAALIRMALPKLLSIRAQRHPEATCFAVLAPEQVARWAETDGTPERGAATCGLHRVGTLRHEGCDVALYEDPFAAPDTILLGWRNGPDDAGAVWAPYVFLGRGAQTLSSVELYARDAFKLIEPGFFTKIVAPLP